MASPDIVPDRRARRFAGHEPLPGSSGHVDWRRSPIDRHGLVLMLSTFVIASGVYTLVGLAIVEWWDPGSAGRKDADLNRWFEDHRTPRLTTVAERFSQAGDPPTKVLLGIVILPLFLWLFRRWHEYALIVGGLLVELATFALSSIVVGRDRPPVEQLDGAPTDSWPSGHIAATTVFYVGLALVIFMQTRRRGPRVIAIVLGVVMPVGMVFARMYLGMHYLTDALGGVVLGALVVSVMVLVVCHTLPPTEDPSVHDREALGPEPAGPPV